MSRSPAHITQAEPLTGETFIYFLRAGEFVKIGRSKRWKVRLAQMQTGSPYTIVPLMVLVGDEKLEKKLHSRFRNSHFHGEWFHMSPAISAFIKENLKDCAAKSDTTDLRKPAGTSWDDREIIL